MSAIETDASISALLSTLIDEVRALRADFRANAEAAACPLLDRKQLSGLLGIDERTLRRLELADEIPAAISLGASKRWRRTDIDAWLAERGAA